MTRKGSPTDNTYNGHGNDSTMAQPTRRTNRKRERGGANGDRPSWVNCCPFCMSFHVTIYSLPATEPAWQRRRLRREGARGRGVDMARDSGRVYYEWVGVCSVCTQDV